MASKKEKTEKTFEEAMQRLDEIADLLDSGEEKLDGSLKLYEEGVALLRFCHETLEKAEQSVKMIRMESDGTFVAEPFTEEKE